MPDTSARGADPAGKAALLRLLLAVAYPFLAHAASLRESGALAALALGTIVGMALAEGLLARRWQSWLGLLVAVVLLVLLARSRFAFVPLLLVPVAFIGMIAWWFARTLRSGQVPLITRIVAALDGRPPQRLEPELQRYARRLTWGWALVLALLAACNLLLAMLAVPDGLLAQVGIASPLPVTETQWSWFANGANYGLVGGFFALEFLYRQHRFPGRYRNFADFARRVAALGPAFWRDLLR